MSSSQDPKNSEAPPEVTISSVNPADFDHASVSPEIPLDVREESGEEAGSDALAADAKDEQIAALQQALEAAQVEAKENWDRALRLQAEMDNLRKRSERDISNAHKFALEKIANELLNVRDSLEMGVQAAGQESADVSSIREGTELTLSMLAQVMEKFNICVIDPLNQAFNPDLHQAISTQPATPEAPNNTVMVVMQKGYTLNERLIRPALVVVAR